VQGSAVHTRPVSWIYELIKANEIAAVIGECNLEAIWRDIASNGLPVPGIDFDDEDYYWWAVNQMFSWYTPTRASRAVVFFLALLGLHPGTAWLLKSPTWPLMLLLSGHRSYSDLNETIWEWPEWVPNY
jgi:hypothetical protein